ncbi:valine-tRNA ligase [Babesia caballi]|uniref:Valine-tRNA ligase n=1 Tax=Babesia caballi TaxID=5871 RepID=A0AAV4LQU7_BABCB|nr:valine-tRNA ligase [Babesia caballi]
MWIRRLQQRYGRKFQEESAASEPDVFREESESNVRRICTRPFFNVDVLGLRVIDHSSARRRGWTLLTFCLVSICVTFYMWFHCYHASCSECLQVVRGGKGSNGEVECHCANCVVNFFFKAKTHFEKCYYSLFFFSGLVMLYVFAIVKALAFEIFRHSNIAQRD